MEVVVNFIRTNGPFLLAASVVVSWYWFLFATHSRSFIKLLLFPIYYFQSIIKVRDKPAVFPIVFSYLIILDGAVGFVFPENPYTFVAGWGLILAWETYGLSSYLFNPKKEISLILMIVGIVLIITIGAIKTIQAQSYQIMNAYDFIEGIYLFIGAVYIIARIIIKGQFEQEIEPFFIFFGLLIYAFLHSLSTILLAFDFMQNYDFAFYSTSITLLFWLVSVPWIRRLRSKLT